MADRPDEGAYARNSQSQQQKAKQNANPLTLILSPTGARGQLQPSFSPAGEKVADRPDEGAYARNSHSQQQKTKQNANPLTLTLSPNPLPRRRKGTAATVLLPRGGEGGRQAG